MSLHTIESRPATALPGFDAAAFELAAQPDTALLRGKREQAFAQYNALPNPQPTDEEYRRTDPALFRIGKFKALPRLRELDEVEPGPWDAAFDMVVTITDRGWHVSRADEAVTGRILVSSLDDAASSHPDDLQALLQGPALPKQPRKFTALNNAFWNVGLFIKIPPKTVISRGILVRYDIHGDHVAILPRLLVVAGKESRFEMVEHFSSPANSAVFCAGCREFYLDPAADVRLVSIQDWSPASVHVGEDWARVTRDARVDLLTLTLGGRVSKMMVGCDVCEPNANAHLGGLYFANGKQHFDQKTLQLHSAPDTFSKMLYKGAVKEKGYSVYQGFIQATQGSIGVDAYQTNNNLVLDPGARADSIPGLLIDADELACSHGATMGNLDAAQLYYLQSRGIPGAEARRMLVMGFFDEVVDRIPHEPIRDHLHDIIARKLGA
jgi:Fe-S cluster assembly protein SufD